MAEKSMPDKMAVSSDNQVGNTPRKDSFSRDEVDLKNPMGAQRPLLDGLPKKKSTFKITSITMNAPRGASSDLTYEADGDSLEDLDESHTEEVSSEILDNSRNTDVELDPASEDTTHNLTPDDTGGKDKVVDVQSRFKVVKIETHEPFRRGRWLCHDFLDLAQAAVEKTEIRAGQQEESHSGNSSAGSSIHYIHGADDPLKNPLAGALPQPQGNQNAQLTNNVHIGHIPSDQTLPGAVQNAVHGSMNIQQNNNDFQPINPAQSNSQSAQISGGVQNTRGETPVPQLSGHGQVLGQVTSQSVLHQSQPQMPQSTVSQQVPSQVGQGIPQGLSQQASVLQQQQQQQQLQQTHAQQQSQQIHHNLVQSQLSNSAMSHSQSVGVMQSAHPQSGAHPQVPQHQTPHSQPPINPMQPPVLHTSQGIPRDVNAGGLPASHLPTNIPDHLKNSVNQTGGAAVHIHNKVHVHQSLLGHDTGNINVRKVSAPSNLQSVPASDASAMPMDKLPHHGGTSSVAAPEGLHIPKGMSGGHTNHMDANKREFIRLDHIGGDDNVHVEASAPSGDMTERSEVTTPLLTPLAAAVGGLSSPTKDGREENQSGSNTLAIDNKIGEAMDLVKSHLMLTVRAEVAVLKEQIKELKEKNSKLEYENSILKASASPETLTKLSQP